MSDFLEKIIIRQFTHDDKQLVDDFFNQMGGETKAFFNRGDGNYKTALRFFEGTALNTVYFLAELDGIMVGYLFLWDIDRSIPWLGIAVHDQYKGMHVGRRLMQYAADYARNNGKGGILLTTHIVNLRGQGLYERMGYERLGMHNSGEVQYLLRF